MKKLSQFLALALAAVTLCSGVAVAQSISTKEILSITIKGVPASEQTRISGEYVVSPDGHVYLPLLQGGIKASGMSSSALARRIESSYRAAQMYQNPRITVVSRKDSAASQIDAQLISVGGFVKSPGQKPYTRGMTLFQAISAAGGETAFGSIRRVELHRNGKKYTYDMRNAAHMRVKVYPNDTINVPQKKWNGT
ncbi:polysaccharide biosynthesis/export family protein [Verrucomicrobiaceae bacterium R5-34]|uniref:Polysaccharide biosynthesis/export family protein n=1 Tax=Oceaniferula flava TaxID=2800421 RepID=A0AAE2SCN0_9BACT|nr:polysaccharide biosynthesis/export family protein [Oceaniferula flavus]MBK1831598.1 polysaccharide biosynthesis/export family protein [Verrucomicrobiaceae bacterium R5-34]MBK1854065.1 polysaccharide biosynthesis/export family protein [Oceaniferula flavus]MBM1135371.1 polysaccharide biosynthesis/export family protein [Oceaniferula flavus]